MLTNKPLLKKHHYPATGRSIIVNRHAHEMSGWKMSITQTERKRYRRGSLRLRGVGSPQQTSVKLRDLYQDEVFTVYGPPGKGKTMFAPSPAQQAAMTPEEALSYQEKFKAAYPHLFKGDWG